MEHDTALIVSNLFIFNRFFLGAVESGEGSDIQEPLGPHVLKGGCD